MFCPEVHFTGYCDDCDAARLARSNRGEVEEFYQTGRASQVQYEAYMHLWARMSPAGSAWEWTGDPEDPAVKEFAEKIYKALPSRLRSAA